MFRLPLSSTPDGSEVAGSPERTPLRFAFVGAASLLLLFSLVLRARVVETLSIHWDEYNFLDKAHRVARGDLTSSLQTFHGHLFSWLTTTSINEVDQIITGRWVMFALAILSCALLTYIGYRLLGGSAGIFAAFVYSSFWYVQHHGTSFRYDGIIATGFLAVTALLLVKPRALWPPVLAGVVGAVSLLVSIKAAVYFPAFAVLAFAPLFLENDRRREMIRAAIFVGTGLVATLALFAWHKSTLAFAASPPTAVAGRAFDTMINVGQPFPRLSALIQTSRWDTPMWVLLFLGFGLVCGAATYERGRARAASLCVLALASPLLALYLYQNSWPYFYVTILPGASLFAGAVWRWAERRASRAPALALIAAVLMAGPVARTAWLWNVNNDNDENAVHRDIVAGVHEIFSEPVPYLDRCSMVASFPRTGWFMSTLGMKAYRATKTDVMSDLLLADQPKLLINNTPILDLHRRRPRGKNSLTKKDFQTLKQNYVHHWGSLWVPGKTLDATPGEGRRFTMLIAGPYTLEGAHSVELDGEILAPGDVVTLMQGEHRLRALDDERVKVMLRYGDHLHKPERSPVRANPLFRGFRAKTPKEKWLNFFESRDGEGSKKESGDDGDDDDDDE